MDRSKLLFTVLIIYTALGSFNMKYTLSTVILCLSIAVASPHKRDSILLDNNTTPAMDPMFGANGLINIVGRKLFESQV